MVGTEGSCDHFFRKVQQAEVRPVQARRLDPAPIQGSEEEEGGFDTSFPGLSLAPTMTPAPSLSAKPSVATESPTFQGSDQVSLLITVDGSCLGCTSHVALFNDVLQRQRKLQQSPDAVQQCVCPEGAELRAPTKEEFLEDFNMQTEQGGNEDQAYLPFFKRAVRILSLIHI